MLTESHKPKQWQGRIDLRDGAFSNRWLDWTSSLAGQHNRILSRLELLSFILIRMAPAEPSSQRWFLSLQPRINLAIHPILRSQLVAQSLMSFSRSEQISDLILDEREASQDNSRKLNASNEFKRLFLTDRSWIQAVVRSEMNHISDTPLFRILLRSKSGETESADSRLLDDLSTERSGITSIARNEVDRNIHAPSTRIFRKFEVVDERLRVPENQFSDQFACRVRQRSQRVEAQSLVSARSVLRSVKPINSGDPAVKSRRGQPNAAYRLSQGEMQSGQIHLPGAPHSITRPQNATQVPQLNIDQLTEQVIRQLDHRIVAQRERMGKI